MKKSFLILIILVSGLITMASAQEQDALLPFILVIDNQFDDGSGIINSKFVVKDRVGNIKDSMICEYRIGKLLMFKKDYKRLFKIKEDTSLRFFFRFQHRKLDMGTDFNYNINFLPFQINNDYIVLKVFNQYDKENQQKYWFYKDKTYFYQIMNPGYIGSLPMLKKDE